MERKFLKPIYHFLPPSNWMNDPNGLIYFKSKYHLFYQFNPYGVEPPYPPNSKVGVHWGHAISDDLIFWKDLPIALFPEKDKPDKDGCWSGNAVNNNGILTLFYTGVFPECICIATSKDGINFEKYKNNPVIKSAPENFEVVGFRDPYVWKEGKNWYMAVGSGIKGRGGVVFLYKSENLYDWEYKGILFEAGNDYGYMWECPNFFKLRDKYVLVVSSIPLGFPIYFIGDYKNFKFQCDKMGKVDLFPYSFYAPQIFKDNKDRTLMIGWLREMLGRQDYEKNGFAGVMSLPRILDIEENQLTVKSIQEVEKLFLSKCLDIEDFIIKNSKNFTLKEVKEISYKLEIKVDLKNTNGFAFSFQTSEMKNESLYLEYDKVEKVFVIDTTKFSCFETYNRVVSRENINFGSDEIFLEIFCDNSVFEIFVNKKFAFSLRIYPSELSNLNLCFNSDKGNLILKKLIVYKLKSIY